MEVKYFFDSYVFIEMMGGNLHYAPYVNEPFFTSFLNAMEVYWAILRDSGEKPAQEEYERLKRSLLEITDDVVFEAMRFRIKYKNKDFSYADCIGYILAQKNTLQFLTGDNAFKGMSNVEFVK